MCAPPALRLHWVTLHALLVRTLCFSRRTKRAAMIFHLATGAGGHQKEVYTVVTMKQFTLYRM